MAIKVKTFEEYEKEAKKSLQGDLQSSLSLNDKTAQTQKDSANTLYKGEIRDAEKSYADEYRDNSIQKLINERSVAENMANMGLTDSGLNRTQQTAVQLSYANNKAKLDIQKQAQVDELARQLASVISGIEVERLSKKQSITDSYNQLAKQTATSLYNTDVEAATEAANRENEWNIAEANRKNNWQIAQINDERERYKIDTEAKTAANKQLLDYNAKVYAADKSYNAKKYEADKSAESKKYIISTDGGLLSRSYTGTLKDNGVDVYKRLNSDYDYEWVYVDNNSGKKTVLPAGQSPHTGTYNKDLFDEKGRYDETRAFAANGYQPNNIGGVKLQQAVYKSGKNKGKAVLYPVRGVDQKIWKANGKFYIWNKDSNTYEEIPENYCREYA